MTVQLQATSVAFLAVRLKLNKATEAGAHQRAMFTAVILSILAWFSVLGFLFRWTRMWLVETRGQPSTSTALPSRPCDGRGLPKLYTVFPRDGSKGTTNVE